MSINILEEIKEGIREAKRGNTMLGLTLLEKCDYREVPAAKAWFGYCLASERRDFRTGVTLCRETMTNNPRLADGYLALGNLYIHNGNRKLAIEILQQGRKWTQNAEISNLLKSIGLRKPPVFSALDRDHAVNVFTGRLLSKLGLR